MNHRLLNILVCPSCCGQLLYNQNTQELCCRADQLAYPIKNDIPVMIPEQARRLSLEEYEHLYKN